MGNGFESVGKHGIAGIGGKCRLAGQSCPFVIERNARARQILNLHRKLVGCAFDLRKVSQQPIATGCGGRQRSGVAAGECHQFRIVGCCCRSVRR